MAVCSLAGYKDFLKPEWMYEILFWEKTLSTNSGCFTNMDTDSSGEDETEFGSELKSSQLPNQTQPRTKRSDAFINIGTQDDQECSVHFTAVSMASLAIHLRYLLETCLLNG